MASPAKRPRPTYFDLPPLEVVTRIATFLSAREHTPSTLAFAKLSNTTRLAVAAALDYRLVIDTTTHIQAAAWQTVFHHSLCHLTISAALPFNPEYIPLLQSTRLQTLSIPPHPEYLQAINHSSSLRNLSLTFVESVLASPGLPKLINVLQTLQITNLSLLSEASYVPSIFQNLFTAFHSEPPLLDLGASCPHVHTLHIAVKLWSMKQLHSVLTRFPSLRHLKLTEIINTHTTFDEPLLHFLRSLDTVQLSHVGSGPTLAAMLSSSLTAIKNTTIGLTDLHALTACRNLRVLDFEINESQELALLHLAKNLRSLRLRWQFKSTHGSFIPQPGVLLNVVRSAPFLSDFHLMDVDVSLQEATGIMQFIGARLKSVGFPLTCMGTSVVKALTWLAWVASRSNPELEELCPGAREELSSAHHWGWQMQPTSKDDGERLMTALSALHQRAPMLKAGVLERLALVLTTDVTPLSRKSSHDSIVDYH